MKKVIIFASIIMMSCTKENLSTVSVCVENTNNTPSHNTEVLLLNNKDHIIHTEKTNIDGYVEFDNLQHGRYKYEIKSNGSVYSRTFTVDKEFVEFKVVLIYE